MQQQQQKQREYLLDNLPLEIILYEISPYLDYNSRVITNYMLPPQDRVGTPLAKDAALQLEICMSITRIRKLVEASTEAKGPRKRALGLLKLFRNVEPLYFVCQYNNGFREAFLERTRAFADASNPEYDNVSRYIRKTLSTLCQKTHINIVEKYPFIRKVNCSHANPAWSPIA